MSSLPSANRRLHATLAHLEASQSPYETSDTSRKAKDDKVDRLESQLRWNGWGYKDTEFYITDDAQCALSGSRYSQSGQTFPLLPLWAQKTMGINIADRTTLSTPSNKMPKVPAPILNDKFLEAVKGHYSHLSQAPSTRLMHAHGHTARDIFRLRFTHFERVPDVVIWPGRFEHVEAIVAAANRFEVCIIPFGGGTSVTHALECPKDEKRMIVSLDMHEMNQIKWIDLNSMTACVEAGITGKDLEERLRQQGLCMGHEPDSIELSTLGGWIATRASGMKKNRYGNIEDIVIRMRVVTSVGSFDRTVLGPRVSSGPDVNQFVLGSEGTLGVITDAVIKVHRLPEEKRYASFAFPSLEEGIYFMRELARERCAPASVRVMDNPQFQFGHALKPPPASALESLSDMAKKFYITNYVGFDLNKMAVATCVFEGSKQDVAIQQTRVTEIAKRFKGYSAGEENGKRGYFLTFMIAYLRDFCFNYSFVAESFETSVPWANVSMLCTNVKARIVASCSERGIPTPFVCCRVTQTYDAGAAVYFYFAFCYKGITDPLTKYEEIEEEAREEVLACGGSISHHHGVGKLRKKYLPQTVGPVGVQMLKSVKSSIDPKNVFGNQNLI